MDARHHGADRDAERRRDLGVAQLLDVAQDDGLAEGLGQRPQRALQVLAARRERVLGRRRRRPLARRARPSAGGASSGGTRPSGRAAGSCAARRGHSSREGSGRRPGARAGRSPAPGPRRRGRSPSCGTRPRTGAAGGEASPPRIARHGSIAPFPASSSVRGTPAGLRLFRSAILTRGAGAANRRIESARLRRSSMNTRPAAALLSVAILAPIPPPPRPSPRGPRPGRRGGVGAPISPYVYGQFIEHLGRCIYGGLWAEMLEDRKFFYPVTGEAPAWEMFTPGKPSWEGEGAPVRAARPLALDDPRRQESRDHGPRGGVRGRAQPAGRPAGRRRRGRADAGAAGPPGRPGVRGPHRRSRRTRRRRPSR